MSDPSPSSSSRSARSCAARTITFRPEAIRFVREGLSHTSAMIHGETKGEPPNRHVTGQQLCLGLRDYALRQYGVLAKAVLQRWGITRTEDFGIIVYALIEDGQLRRSQQDSIDDFVGVYDFDDAFGVQLA